MTATMSSNTNHFLVHRSTSIIAGTSRSASYEEELEERLDAVRVGAQTWQQRALVERHKRLAVLDQLAEQEHCYRTMMENLREQDEQKYERLKNRARVLMRRSEHLRTERQQLENKISHVIKKAASDRQTWETKVNNLTEEVERLKAANDTRMIAEVNTLRKGGDDKAEVWGQYKCLFEIALMKIEQLERVLGAAQEEHRSPNVLQRTPNVLRDRVRLFNRGTVPPREVKRRSLSCPTVLPSAGRVPVKLQVRLQIFPLGKEFPSKSARHVSKPSEANRSLEDAEKSIYVTEATLSPSNTCDINNYSNDGDTKRNFTERDNCMLKTGDSKGGQLLRESPPHPFRSGRPMSLNTGDRQSHTVADLSPRHTASIRKWYSEACSSSSSKRSETRKRDFPDSTSVTARSLQTDKSAADTAYNKPRRIVSLQKLDLFKKFQNFGVGIAASEGGGGMEKSKPESSQDSDVKLDAAKVMPETEILTGCVDEPGHHSETMDKMEVGGVLEVGVVGDDSFRSVENQGASGWNKFEQSMGDVTPQDVTLNNVLPQDVTPQNVTPQAERGLSSFDRLRQRRNGLTSVRNFQIRPAVSCSKLDQIANSIKTYLK